MTYGSVMYTFLSTYTILAILIFNFISVAVDISLAFSFGVFSNFFFFLENIIYILEYSDITPGGGVDQNCDNDKHLD
jgi:hypothetical protein